MVTIGYYTHNQFWGMRSDVYPATNKSGLDYVVQHRPSHAVDQFSTIYYSILVFLVLFALMSSTARMMVKQLVVWPQRALIG